MSQDNGSNDRRESDDQAPNPSPSSQERMNREEEEAQWQQQQQQSANSGGGAADQSHHHPRESPNFPPQQQHNMMMIPPDFRYLQEMRRMEEMMMAAGRGGGPLVGASRGGMHSPRHGAAGYSNQWHPSEAGAGPEGHPQPPGADSVAQMPPGGGRMMSPSPRENPGNHPPSMGLLALLQREQERLMHAHSGPAAESWLPAAKRQRLPPGALVDPWMVAHNNKMGQMMPGDAPHPHKERKRHVKSFPVKLMETLNGCVNDNVFAWLPDGKSFVVVDPEAFCSNVLTATFKGGKYTSFVRKLNRWGFSRLISGTGIDCFHNSLFQRDQPALCELITSSAERDDTAGVDPALLGSKPSLAGIETYMAIKDKKEGTFAKLETEESKDVLNTETKQGETGDERKRAAVPESSSADADEDERPTNVASV